MADENKEKPVELVTLEVLVSRNNLGPKGAIVKLAPDRAKYWIDLKVAKVAKK